MPPPAGSTKGHPHHPPLPVTKICAQSDRPWRSSAGRWKRRLVTSLEGENRDERPQAAIRRRTPYRPPLHAGGGRPGGAGGAGRDLPGRRRLRFRGSSDRRPRLHDGRPAGADGHFRRQRHVARLRAVGLGGHEDGIPVRRGQARRPHVDALLLRLRRPQRPQERQELLHQGEQHARQPAVRRARRQLRHVRRHRAGRQDDDGGGPIPGRDPRLHRPGVRVDRPRDRYAVPAGLGLLSAEREGGREMKQTLTYFSLLGISEDASQEELEARYRELADYLASPDLPAGLREWARSQAALVDEAYAVLADAEQRAAVRKPQERAQAPVAAAAPPAKRATPVRPPKGQAVEEPAPPAGRFAQLLPRLRAQPVIIGAAIGLIALGAVVFFGTDLLRGGDAEEAPPAAQAGDLVPLDEERVAELTAAAAKDPNRVEGLFELGGGCFLA